MKTVRFRDARSADASALLGLVTAAYRGASSRSGWTTEADLLDGGRITLPLLQKALESPDTRFLIAERGEDRARDIIACAQIVKKEAHAEFGLFAVRPWLQGHGIGRAVLAEAERLARDDMGLSRLEMSVIDARLELIAWYERRGYRRTGEYRPFPYGDERFGIPKRDDLRFAVLAKALG